MKIPVAKPYLTETEAQASYEAVMSGWVTQGPKVREFEEKFAQYVGSRYAVAVSNCTTALHLSLLVAGVGPGDEVICPSYSFIATANSITYVGARPVFADVEHTTGNLDPQHVAGLITSKTKAILLVHQLGRPADLQTFTELANKHNIKIIEDAACAIGSSYRGKKIGQHSDLVCFSFHPRKVITTGDGGMITTSNEAYYKQLLLLRQHGMSISDRDRHHSQKVMVESYPIKGFNYRMTDIQASLGIKQLEKLDWIVEERRKIARKYFLAFKDEASLEVPLEDDEYYWNYQSYSLYIRPQAPLQPLTIMQKLLDVGISTRRGVMLAHKEEAYREYQGSVLPVSENLSQRSIILPLYVPMTQEETEYVIRHLKVLLN